MAQIFHLVVSVDEEVERVDDWVADVARWAVRIPGRDGGILVIVSAKNRENQNRGPILSGYPVLSMLLQLIVDFYARLVRPPIVFSVPRNSRQKRREISRDPSFQRMLFSSIGRFVPEFQAFRELFSVRSNP